MKREFSLNFDVTKFRQSQLEQALDEFYFESNQAKGLFVTEGDEDSFKFELFVTPKAFSRIREFLTFDADDKKRFSFKDIEGSSPVFERPELQDLQSLREGIIQYRIWRI